MSWEGRKKQNYLYMSFSIILAWIARFGQTRTAGGKTVNGEKLLAWFFETKLLSDGLSFPLGRMCWPRRPWQVTELRRRDHIRGRNSNRQHLHFCLVGVTLFTEKTRKRKDLESERGKGGDRRWGRAWRTQRNLLTLRESPRCLWEGHRGACSTCWPRTGYTCLSFSSARPVATPCPLLSRQQWFLHSACARAWAQWFP